jgi:hypothetical protein
MCSAIARRILCRLEQAETREPNPHLQDDYRIAWITVLRAARGESIPHVSATYAVLGLHPDKVGPAIEARRRALLGIESLPAKKPVQSVRAAEGSKTQTARDRDSRAA